jgi:hypothetical protein
MRISNVLHLTSERRRQIERRVVVKVIELEECDNSRRTVEELIHSIWREREYLCVRYHTHEEYIAHRWGGVRFLPGSTAFPTWL